MFSSAKYGVPFANLPSPPSQQSLCGAEFHGISPSRQDFALNQSLQARDVCRYLPPFSGLKTPPTDDMSAACHHQPVGTYEPHALPSYPPTYPPTVFSHSQCEKPSLPEEVFHQTQHLHNQPQELVRPPADRVLTQSRAVQLPPQQHSLPQPLPQPQPQARLPTLDQLESRASRGLSMARLAPGVVADVRSSKSIPTELGPLSRSSTPSSTVTMASLSKENMSRQLTDHSSEIPDFISPRGGSLADFVAQVRCPVHSFLVHGFDDEWYG